MNEIITRENFIENYVQDDLLKVAKEFFDILNLMNYSTPQVRMIVNIIKKINVNGYNKEKKEGYKLSIEDFAEIYDLKDTSLTKYKSLLKGLQSKVIYWHDEKENKDISINFLKEIIYDRKTKEFTCKLSDKISEYLFNIKGLYMLTKAKNVEILNNKSSIALYFLLRNEIKTMKSFEYKKDFENEEENKKIIEVEMSYTELKPLITDLKKSIKKEREENKTPEKISFEDVKYDKYSDWKKYVFNDCIKDLNEYTDLKVEVKEEGTQDDKRKFIFSVSFNPKNLNMLAFADKIKKKKSSENIIENQLNEYAKEKFNNENIDFVSFFTEMMYNEKFETDVYYCLLDYASQMPAEKQNTKYMRSIINTWHEQGVITVSDAEKYISQLHKIDFKSNITIEKEKEKEEEIRIAETAKTVRMKYDYLDLEYSNALMRINKKNGFDYSNFDFSQFEEVIEFYKEISPQGIEECRIDGENLKISSKDANMQFNSLNLLFKNNILTVGEFIFVENEIENLERLINILQKLKKEKQYNAIEITWIYDENTRKKLLEIGFLDEYINDENRRETFFIDNEKVGKAIRVEREKKEKEEFIKTQEKINEEKPNDYYDFLHGAVNKEAVDEDIYEEEAKTAKEMSKNDKVKKNEEKYRNFLTIVKFFKDIMKERISECYIQSKVLYISETEQKNNLYLRFSDDMFFIQVFFEKEENYKHFLVLLEKIKNIYKIKEIKFTLVENEYFISVLEKLGYCDMNPSEKEKTKIYIKN